MFEPVHIKDADLSHFVDIFKERQQFEFEVQSQYLLKVEERKQS